MGGEVEMKIVQVSSSSEESSTPPSLKRMRNDSVASDMISESDIGTPLPKRSNIGVSGVYAVFKVVVGPKLEGFMSQNKFHIERELLSRSSVTLRVTVSNICRSSAAPLISLHDKDLAAFEIYYDWLKQIWPPLQLDVRPSAASAVSQDDAWARLRPLFNAYLLGTQLKDSKFKNAVLDVLYETVMGLPLPLAPFVHDTFILSEKDGLNIRGLLVLAVIQNPKARSALRVHYMNYPRTFVLAVAMELFRVAEETLGLQNTTSIFIKCDLHEHQDGAKCAAS